MQTLKMWLRRLRGGTTVREKDRMEGDAPTGYDSRYAGQAEKVEKVEAPK